MRLSFVKAVLVGSLAFGLALPPAQPAHASIFGLLTAPLRMFAHGFAGRRLHHFRHYREASHAYASRGRPEATAEPRSESPPSAAATRAAAPPNSIAAWPTASPNVYEDLLGYALWPKDYSDRLWGHGYTDIMGALLTPAAATSPKTDQETDQIATGMCSDQAKTLAEEPLTRVEQQLSLTPPQQTALAGLRTALGEAVDRGKATVCAQAPSSSQSDRMKRVIDGLWSMWDATVVLNAPLTTFYDSLTDAQKMQLNGASHAGPIAACTDQRPVSFPGERASRSTRDGKEASEDLQALRERSTEMAKYLTISCPPTTPATPMARLQAESARMNALLYAVMNMDPALSAYYSSIETEPKK